MVSRYYLKKQWLSKTNWLGLFAIASGVLDYIARDPLLVPYPNTTAIMLVVVGCLGIVIRQYTDRPVAALFDRRQ